MIEIAPSQIYTIRDVAEYFKCSTRKVHRLVASGELRGFKIGNQRRFKGDEILQFIERRNDSGHVTVIAPVVQPDRLYSLREVSALLQVSSNEVVHLLRTGRLAGFRVGMEWRCWGRDLLKLSPTLNADTANDADTLQPSLLQMELRDEPAVAPSDMRDESDEPLAPAA
ncbi:MAG: helix-turn-helix domain-containing protein [Chloroflexota bacterium]